MKTIVKLVLTLLVLVMAVLPASAGTPAATKTAAAMTTAGKVRYYYVYYRYGPRHPWVFYGGYRRLADARYVARVLQHWYGVETFIR